MNKILGMLVCILFLSGSSVYAATNEPRECPKDLKYALGLYYGNGEQFVLRERGGELELLYRFSREDYKFAKSNIFPLKKERFDSYTLVEAGPMNNAEVSVKLERNQEGYVNTCKIGGNRYTRGFLGGDGGKPLRIDALKDWTALQNNAKEAVMPTSLAQGKPAQLVDISKVVHNVKLDLRYAGYNNLFGAPIVDVNKAYMDQVAAEALAKVQKRLAEYGYALVIWEAYRPWSSSKLAYDALPQDKKTMLPEPDKGFSHNTGRAVDISLYYLDSREQVEMISDFDEPSFRQYSSFLGGTELQRYQRDLLQQLMSLEGFSSSEMEWWHFEYDKESQYQHLNTPLENLS